jgi:tryptophanyl-tRNA synthetase
MQKIIHSEQSRTIFSGIKPTGRPHIGNYFGAMKQFVELQNEHQGGYFMIADYHALNLIQDAQELKQLTLDVAIDFLAIGLDPQKSVIFKQSDIPEHTELTWIFDSITTVSYLMRGHAFKDAFGKNLFRMTQNPSSVLSGKTILDDEIFEKVSKESLSLSDVSMGNLNYPMLMAADILLYDVDMVPVGQDQKQHIEFARDTAEKFNRIFGETFKLPEAYIIKDVETVPGTDGKKMSKSYDNTIPLFATDEEIEKAVMSIVTDSSGEKPENVFAIHKLLKPADELEKVYQENKGKYKVLKEMLIEDLKNFIKPMREKREGIARDLDLVNKVLEEGKLKAHEVASVKMQVVKKAVGVI